MHSIEVCDLKNMVSTLKLKMQELQDQVLRLRVAGGKQTSQIRSKLYKSYICCHCRNAVNKVTPPLFTSVQLGSSQNHGKGSGSGSGDGRSEVHVYGAKYLKDHPDRFLP